MKYFTIEDHISKSQHPKTKKTTSNNPGGSKNNSKTTGAGKEFEVANVQSFSGNSGI